MDGLRKNSKVLIITLIVLVALAAAMGGCATEEKTAREDKKDPVMVQDARYCRSLSGLDEVGRNDPQAYRTQALYNKCMKDRGWPGN